MLGARECASVFVLAGVVHVNVCLCSRACVCLGCVLVRVMSRGPLAFWVQDAASRRTALPSPPAPIPPHHHRPPPSIATRQAAALMSQRLVVAIDGWEADSMYPSGHYVRSLGPIGDKDTETVSGFLAASRRLPGGCRPGRSGCACLSVGARARKRNERAHAYTRARPHRNSAYAHSMLKHTYAHAHTHAARPQPPPTAGGGADRERHQHRPLHARRARLRAAAAVVCHGGRPRRPQQARGAGGPFTLSSTAWAQACLN
jgi:hypothetical protein